MITADVRQLPIVVYPTEDGEGGIFTAHALTLDLIEMSDTIDGAVIGLVEMMEAAIAEGKKHGANVFRDAPGRYWAMYVASTEHVYFGPRRGGVGG